MKHFLLTFGLLLQAVSASAQNASGTIGDFALLRNVDPATGVNRSSIMTPGDVARARGAALVWRCTGKGVEVAFTTRHQLGAGSVQPRAAGLAGMSREDWSPAPHGKAATLHPGAVGAFTAAAKSAGSMAFRVEDARGGAFAYTLGLRGLSEALDWLSCGG